MAEGTVSQVLAGDAAWAIVHGDLRERLAGPPGDFADAVVCDPPYELGFMSKRWDGSGVAVDPKTWAAVPSCASATSDSTVHGGASAMPGTR